jgi:hypothetical protein
MRITDLGVLIAFNFVVGCASSQQGFNYTRVDGRPVDAAQGQAALL